MKAGMVAALGLIVLSAGCTSTGSTSGGAAVMAGAEVTRFHLGRNIARGEIAVEPLDAPQGGSLEFARHAAAVERQLSALGWTVTRSNRRSEQVALVRLEQGSREALRRRSGLSIGLGGGSYGRGGGIGGGISVPIGGGGTSRQVVITELAVRLQRRSDGTTMWEGRAQAEALAGTPAAQPTMMVDRLAQALFQGFPGESGRTVRVR
jgi:hypothetical protein